MSEPKTVILPPQQEPKRTPPDQNNEEQPTTARPSVCCDKIREVAYLKWEASGCPCSDGVEFWLRAEAELTNDQPTGCQEKEA